MPAWTVESGLVFDRESVLGHVDEILRVSVLPLHPDAHLASARDAQERARETTGRNPLSRPSTGRR
jgi:hypothetical protein